MDRYEVDNMLFDKYEIKVSTLKNIDIWILSILCWGQGNVAQLFSNN